MDDELLASAPPISMTIPFACTMSRFHTSLNRLSTKPMDFNLAPLSHKDLEVSIMLVSLYYTYITIRH